jgi:hypothetical protein
VTVTVTVTALVRVRVGVRVRVRVRGVEAGRAHLKRDMQGTLLEGCVGNEGVGELRGKGGVEPYGRGSCVERLQRQLLGSVAQGRGPYVGLFVGRSHLV